MYFAGFKLLQRGQAEQSSSNHGKPGTSQTQQRRLASADFSRT
jgi:hypothetical protein